MSINLNSRSHQTVAFVRNEGNVKGERARRFEQSINGSNIKVDVYTVAGSNVVPGLDLSVTAEDAAVEEAKAVLEAAGLTVSGSVAGGTVTDAELRAAAADVGYNTVLILSGTSL
jgi:predicted TIM-barrel enzyme